MQLKKLNDDRKLGGYAKKIDEYKRFVQAVSVLDVPRVAQLIRQAVKRGESIQAIHALLIKAAQGSYHAKQFTQDDIDIGALALRCGGPRTAHALHVALGTPSVPYLLGVLRAIKFLCVHGDDDIASITKANVNSVMEGDHPRGLTFDDSAITAKPGHDYITNKIAGICSEHGYLVNLLFRALEDVYAIYDAVQRGDVHIAREASVMGLTGLGEFENECRPIFATATCRKGTAIHQQTLIQAVLGTYYNEKLNDKFGDIFFFATDGDSKRRIALNGMIESNGKLSDDIGKHLAGIRGLDLLVLNHDVVPTWDPKHNLKRFRWRIISPNIHVLIGSKAITAAQLQHHMYCAGLKKEEVRSMFKPVDKMNVPSAIKLLSTIQKLPPLCEVKGNDPKFESYDAALVILQVILDASLSMFDVNQAIAQQLTKLSRLGHLLGYLFSASKAAFIPSQLYHDTQGFIKSAFIVAARGIEHANKTGSFKLLLAQIGSNFQENLFAELRTLSHNRNCDMMELQQNLALITQISAVYDRHPEFKRDRQRDVPQLEKRDSYLTVRININFSTNLLLRTQKQILARMCRFLALSVWIKGLFGNTT